MQSKTNNTDTKLHDHDLDGELAGILTAISIVSKRFAKKLLSLQQSTESIKKAVDDQNKPDPCGRRRGLIPDKR